MNTLQAGVTNIFEEYIHDIEPYKFFYKDNN